MVLYFLSGFPHLARITLHSPLLYFTLLCIVQLHIIVKSPLLAALQNNKESEHKGIRSALAGVLNRWVLVPVCTLINLQDLTGFEDFQQKSFTNPLNIVIQDSSQDSMPRLNNDESE